MTDQLRVFVYGTLKRGHYNHRLLEESEFLGKSVIKGTMYNLGSFPALSLHGNTDIRGEVFAVDEPTMKRLDRLEGYPDFYDRQKVETSLGDAWVYTMDERDGAPVVKSGEWLGSGDTE